MHKYFGCLCVLVPFFYLKIGKFILFSEKDTLAQNGLMGVGVSRAEEAA